MVGDIQLSAWNFSAPQLRSGRRGKKGVLALVNFLPIVLF
jgi:hypothetical protein